MSYTSIDNEIFEDENLTMKEFKLLMTLIRYYNTNLGYSFPPVKTLCKHMNTKNTTSVHNVIKSLELKGYIKKDKHKRNNIYFILKYLVIEDNQEISQEQTPEEKELIEVTKLPQDQVKELLKTASNDLQKILNYYEYAKSKKNVISIFHYVKFCIENNIILSGNKVIPIGEKRNRLRTDNATWRTDDESYVNWLVKQFEG